MNGLSWFRYHLKLIRITAHFVRGLLICLILFPWLNRDAKRKHVQRWSARLLVLFDVHVKTELARPLSGNMIVSNHISWLDIFVINSFSPSRFIAKADIRAWPFIGWLTAKTGTIYIARGNKSDLKRIYRYLIDQLIDGEQIAFFPEGTTTTQGQLLPFHSNLFEAAIHSHVSVQPVALRYLTKAGEWHPEVDYSGGTTFVTSLKRILNSRDIVVELHVQEIISSDGAHRRELALASRLAVAQALRVEMEDKN